jgi:hypothetical protein
VRLTDSEKVERAQCKEIPLCPFGQEYYDCNVFELSSSFSALQLASLFLDLLLPLMIIQSHGKDGKLT